MRLLVLGGALLAATVGIAHAQDLAAGEQSFRKCSPCHSVGEDARNKIGPVLNGLDGRKAGTAAEYNFSDANKNSGITWDEANLHEWLKNPKAKVPGTKMIFQGYPDDKKINDVIAYLKTQS